MPLVPLQLGDKEGVQRCIKSMQLFDELQKRMRENFDGDLHCFWQYSELEPQALIDAYFEHLDPCVSCGGRGDGVATLVTVPVSSLFKFFVFSLNIGVSPHRSCHLASRCAVPAQRSDCVLSPLGPRQLFVRPRLLQRRHQSAGTLSRLSTGNVVWLGFISLSATCL